VDATDQALVVWLNAIKYVVEVPRILPTVDRP
jgi:hypothetical protein